MPWCQVTREQMYLDLGKDKMDKMEIEDDPYLSCAGAHAIAIMTEWDVFKTLDLQKIYDAMQKPAFIFDGRAARPKRSRPPWQHGARARLLR